MLSYKVLDLANERGILCGKILADLGADVIKIEQPGGDPARFIGPFYQNRQHPEHSLYWWAYSSNKRGITLDIEKEKGKKLFEKMLATADILIESFQPGYLSALGLGYDILREINPKLIMISITPYGQKGPYAGFKADDLSGSAMGGLMYITGEPDGPPVRIGYPQFFHHGAAGGAIAALIAARWRKKTGLGQWVDISCQESIARSLSQVPQNYEAEGFVVKRSGNLRRTGKNTFMRQSWECKDGFINFMLGGGNGAAGSIRSLIAWMGEAEFDVALLRSIDWEGLAYGGVSGEILEKIAPEIERFFKHFSKTELLEQAAQRRILLFPVSTIQDILEDDHLKARQFFDSVSTPYGSFLFPGSFMKIPAGTAVSRPAPKIGEHNKEVYRTDLGLSAQEISELESQGIL